MYMGRFDFYDSTEIVKSFYLTPVGAAAAVEEIFQLCLGLLTGHCFPSVILWGISWFHSTIQYIFEQPAHFSELITTANSSIHCSGTGTRDWLERDFKISGIF